MNNTPPTFDVTPIKARRQDNVDEYLIKTLGHDLPTLVAAVRAHPVEVVPDVRQQINEIETKVSRARALVLSVLSKYPRETVPPKLHWAYRRILSVTKSNLGDIHLVQQSDSGTEHYLITRIPAKLLTADEQTVRAWARNTYWEERRVVRAQEYTAARDNVQLRRNKITVLKRQLAAAELEDEKAQQALDRESALIMRSSRAKARANKRRRLEERRLRNEKENSNGS